MNHKIIKKVQTCVENQNDWRGKKTINLIASENVCSKLATSLSYSDFAHRYAEGVVFHREYQGQHYQDQIEAITIAAVKRLFNSKYADVRCPTATIGNIAIYYGLCKRGDQIFTLSVPNGAHISMRKFGGAGLRGLKIFDIPFDYDNYNIDMDLFGNLILGIKPKLITLGASVFLFPHPIEEIRKICDETNTIIHYDASHILGLIAGGKFQDPLGEGADVVIGSTHKTFPGPQGAIIITNNEDYFEKIQQGIFPGTVSNHHLHRLPPLTVVCEEMQEFGEDYANQIIVNAQFFAKELDKRGFKVLGKKLGYTQSHQILLDLSQYGKGLNNALLLEKADIITNKNLIHGDLVNKDTFNPSGMRLGVQEMTHVGMKQEEFKLIAEFFERLIIKEESIDSVKKDVNFLRSKFIDVKYSFDEELGGKNE
ncbi:MAG: serine hydroxymethyltransferase [Candidatus Lokiarchaeota archaeon]|nr:serine hydroxymethyltransferase [Candidatus Lokiarchaeota archaeon]